MLNARTTHPNNTLTIVVFVITIIVITLNLTKDGRHVRESTRWLRNASSTAAG